MKIRRFLESDISQIVSLFYGTVHFINKQDYTQEQLDVWAPLDEMSLKLETWKDAMQQNITYVADYSDQIVGFADMTLGGYLDRLYVHKDYQRKRIASALLHELETEACRIGLKEIETEASITAKPFFERHGYREVESQIVERRGVKLVNFKMIKML